MLSQLSIWKTWYGYNPRTLSFNKNTIYVEETKEVFSISHTSEIVLSIVLHYLFVPVWLLDKWEVNWRDFLRVGLCWSQQTLLGEFIRPTKNLFTLFNQKLSNYYPIPYSNLQHTIWCMDILFDLSMGNILIDGMPYQFVLNEPPPEFLKYGVFCIPESRIRTWKEVKGNEFENFRVFTIFKNGKKHTCDIVVLGKHIAIEVELSYKSPQRYKNIMDIYKDSIFDKVLWIGNEVVKKISSEHIVRRPPWEEGRILHLK